MTSASSLRTGYFLSALTVTLWASFVVLSRLAGPSHLNPFDLAALRFSVAAVVLLPAWALHFRFKLFDGQLIALALFGGLGYALGAYTGLHIAPASHGAVLLSGILPFFMTVMAYFVLQEHPTRERKRALFVIAMGVVCMAINSLGGLAQSWRGDIVLICSSALWALYTVFVKRWNRQPVEVTVGVGLWSAFIYVPIYILFLPKTIAEASWGTIALQGFFHGILVVIVAMLFFMQAMVRLGPTRLGAVMSTVPAIAGLGAVVFLHEPLTLWLVLGLCLTSLGAWLGSRG